MTAPAARRATVGFGACRAESRADRRHDPMQAKEVASDAARRRGAQWRPASR